LTARIYTLPSTKALNGNEEVNRLRNYH
jgi:hypothetical protein